MSRQQLRGKAKKDKGRVKEAVGIISGDRKLEQEGARERVEGAVQEGFDKARKKVGDMLTDLAHAINK